MSTAADSKSGEAGEDNWNLMATGKRSKCGWLSQSPGKATLTTQYSILLLMVVTGIIF